MTTLNLKLYGLAGPDDLKLIVENCRSLEGVKILKAIYHRDGSDVMIEIKDNFLKSQVFDIIKLAGDVRIEEQGDQPTILASERKTAPGDYSSGDDFFRRYFYSGLLIGFSIISFLLNVILFYIIFRAK